MAKGINPLVYRIGFSRPWESLFTSSYYLTNYDFFFKSQLINNYIEGFFKKWTWNGRRSYYENFLYSHTEVSWSLNCLNINIYIYFTIIDLLYFKYQKILKKFKVKNLVKKGLKSNSKIVSLYIIFSIIYLANNYKYELFKKLLNYYKVKKKKFFLL